MADQTNTSEQRAHAYYGASSSHIWLNCTAAVPLWRAMEADGAPEPVASEYAILGTRAHELAEQSILALACASQTTRRLSRGMIGMMHRAYPEKISETVRRVHGDTMTEPLPDDVVEAVTKHVHLVCDHVRSFEPEDVYLEHRFDLSGIYDSYSASIRADEARKDHRALFGTADVVLVCDSVLIVIDYKNGSGVPVSARGNPQLRYYALGAYMSLPRQARQGIQTVRWIITQPRLPGTTDTNFWSQDECSVSELLSFGGEIVSAVEAAEGAAGEATFRPGAHCRFCRAAGTCPELKKRAQELARNVFQGSDDATREGVKTLSDRELGDALRDLEIIEPFMRAAKDQALDRLLQGRTIPGYKAVTSTTQKKWRDEKAAGQTLGNMVQNGALALEQVFKPRTPTAVSRVWAGADKGTLDALVEPGQPKPALGTEDDKRKDWNPNGQAAARFPD